MDDRFVALAAEAANRHGVFTTIGGTATGCLRPAPARVAGTGLDRTTRHAHVPIRRHPRHVAHELAAALAISAPGRVSPVDRRPRCSTSTGSSREAPSCGYRGRLRHRGRPGQARSTARPLLSGDVDRRSTGSAVSRPNGLILDSLVFRFTSRRDPQRHRFRHPHAAGQRTTAAPAHRRRTASQCTESSTCSSTR